MNYFHFLSESQELPGHSCGPDLGGDIQQHQKPINQICQGWTYQRWNAYSASIKQLRASPRGRKRTAGEGPGTGPKKIKIETDIDDEKAVAGWKDYALALFIYQTKIKQFWSRGFQNMSIYFFAYLDVFLLLSFELK